MEQFAEFIYGGGIYKFGAIDEVGDMGKIILFGFFRRDESGTNLIGGIGRCGDIYLVIGDDPQPDGGPGQKLQGGDKVRDAGIGNDGQKNCHDEADIVVKGYPGGKIVLSVLEIEDLQALTDAAHEVSISDHNTLWRTGGAGGILQIQQVISFMRSQFAQGCGFYLIGVDALECHNIEEGFFEQ